MQKIELSIDDTIFERFMGLIELLPRDKIKVSYAMEDEKKEPEVSKSDDRISELLKEAYLSHFKYFKDTSKIVYTQSSGSARHIEDYKRLVALLNQNGVKFSAVGIDVLLIEDS